MPPTNVLPLSNVSAELSEQFQPLGGDSSIRSMMRGIKTEGLFAMARGAINSFVADTETRIAIACTYDGADFSSRCEADAQPDEETVSFRPSVWEDAARRDEVVLLMSPNALKTVMGTVMATAEGQPRDQNRPPFEHKDGLLSAYRGLYALALTRYIIMRHALDHYDLSPKIEPRLQDNTELLYRKSFGLDKVEDTAVQLHRLTMAVGGTVLLRTLAASIRQGLSSRADHSEMPIGHSLKMCAVGLKLSNPHDQKEASFALAHAMQPQEAASFMRFWFSPHI